MTLSLRSPEDVVNNALVRIGARLRVTNIFDGTPQANAALDIYSQTRDELLRQNDWDFAERTMQPTLLKFAPPGGYFPPTVWDPASNPPPPYFFEYAYPDDCLKVRALKPAPLLIPNFDPQPNVFSVGNDNAYTPPRKVILCFVAQVLMTYTGQVTDPVTWEADFAEAAVAALARRLAPSLVSMEAAKLNAVDEMQAMAVAEREMG